MIPENIVGYWVCKDDVNFHDEVLMIDKFGRFVSKIPDDRDQKLVGGWQRFWIKLVNENRCQYAASMSIDFNNSWEIFISVSDNQIKITRDNGFRKVYSREQRSKISQKYLRLEEQIVKKM